MSRREEIEQFEKRWTEAKASGCSGVLFEKGKWRLIDMLLEEAKLVKKLRRDLIEAEVVIRALDAGGPVRENKNGHGGNVNSKSGRGGTTRAA